MEKLLGQHLGWHYIRFGRSIDLLVTQYLPSKFGQQRAVPVVVQVEGR